MSSPTAGRRVEGLRLNSMLLSNTPVSLGPQELLSTIELIAALRNKVAQLAGSETDLTRKVTFHFAKFDAGNGIVPAEIFVSVFGPAEMLPRPRKRGDIVCGR